MHTNFILKAFSFLKFLTCNTNHIATPGRCLKHFYFSGSPCSSCCRTAMLSLTFLWAVSGRNSSSKAQAVHQLWLLYKASCARGVLPSTEFKGSGTGVQPETLQSNACPARASAAPGSPKKIPERVGLEGPRGPPGDLPALPGSSRSTLDCSQTALEHPRGEGSHRLVFRCTYTGKEFLPHAQVNSCASAPCLIAQQWGPSPWHPPTDIYRY